MKILTVRRPYCRCGVSSTQCVVRAGRREWAVWEGLERALPERVRVLRPELRRPLLRRAAEGSGSLAAIERAASDLGVADPVSAPAELTDLLRSDGSPRRRSVRPDDGRSLRAGASSDTRPARRWRVYFRPTCFNSVHSWRTFWPGLLDQGTAISCTWLRTMRVGGSNPPAGTVPRWSRHPSLGGWRNW
jgi:hypothetical protein